MGASSSHVSRKSTDVVELSLPSSLSSSRPSSTARITFRSPGAPGTDTHTSSGTADTTSYCFSKADVVPKDLFQRCLPAPFSEAPRASNLNFASSAPSSAPHRTRCQAIAFWSTSFFASGSILEPRPQRVGRRSTRMMRSKRFLRRKPLPAAERITSRSRSDDVATSAMSVGRNATTNRSTFLLPVRRAFMSPSSRAPVPPLLSPPPAIDVLCCFVYLLVSAAIARVSALARAAVVLSPVSSCEQRCARIVGFGALLSSLGKFLRPLPRINTRGL
mmetsp:Transcript_24276/g.63293  ORF Transcript_24276/g.63293 Transcript_24276/m.63293 type:complete len:275 (+) Transcript_24276:1141-1965(+)